MSDRQKFRDAVRSPFQLNPTSTFGKNNSMHASGANEINHDINTIAMESSDPIRSSGNVPISQI